MRLPTQALLVSIISLLVGCEGDSAVLSPPGHTGVTILGISKVVPTFDESTGVLSDCEYLASAAEFTSEVRLDTAFASALEVPLTVRNEAVDDSMAVRPLRMVGSWFCGWDDAPFDGGAIPLAGIDLGQMACRASDTPPEASLVFPVRAGGPESMIPGGPGLGVVEVPLVPHEWGEALDSTFRIGGLAEQCCFETRSTDCDGRGESPACRELAEIFAALDPSGEQLRVDRGPGPSPDLVRFQAFSIFNGENLCARDRTLCDSSRPETPAYPMHFRGRLEFLDGEGRVVSSNEHATRFGFCHECGGSPRIETACFAR